MRLFCKYSILSYLFHILIYSFLAIKKGAPPFLLSEEGAPHKQNKQ